jgi:hypothetical protein
MILSHCHKTVLHVRWCIMTDETNYVQQDAEIIWCCISMYTCCLMCACIMNDKSTVRRVQMTNLMMKPLLHEWNDEFLCGALYWRTCIWHETWFRVFLSCDENCILIVLIERVFIIINCKNVIVPSQTSCIYVYVHGCIWE